MTTAIFSVVTVVALLWMLRVEARLREIFDRLERLQRQPGQLPEGPQDPIRFF
ncbi:hypothetical protein V5F53_08235 [Xanthobacter sp. V4C-4]|uniref:hypothetical protein n=1 Tax=Xanthobacter cornucopiae TaxID=3119924 RepID=UPI0037285847